MKPNCGNCIKATFTRGDNWLNGGVLCEGKELLPDFVATIKIKGCLSHPNAREYLMQDVVKELERLSNLNCHASYKYAMEQAIALIRGVK